MGDVRGAANKPSSGGNRAR